jgi:hypothetical protein
MSIRQNLKQNLTTIYNFHDNDDLISLYRKLRIHNDNIRLYTNDSIYQMYITELYSILDEYMYGDGNEDNIVKNKCYMVLRKVIKSIK